MSGWVARGILASVLAAGSVLTAPPPPALACSGLPLTFADAVATSELIVEGTVEEVLLDGLAFRLAVLEVFKGSPLGSSVRLGPEAEAGRGCEIGLAVGDHVILGVVDIDAHLNSLGTAVWFIAPDGSLSSTGELWRAAANVTELRARLRAAMPDTALAPESNASVAPALVAFGAALLLLGATLVVRFGRSREPLFRRA